MLRKKLVKIYNSEDLEPLVSTRSIGEISLESASALHRAGITLDVVKPLDGLKKIQNRDFEGISPRELFQLEAIVEREGRPVAFVVGGTYEKLPHPWGRLNDDTKVRDRINRAASSVGRVERFTPSGGRTDHIGTGFIVGSGLMMTNRHVAEIFLCGGGSERVQFVSNGAFDLSRERGFDPTDLSDTVRITGIRLIHPFWDMALLEVDLPESAPIGLSTEPLDKIIGREIVTIGYPGRGKDTRPAALELERRHFHNVYGVKRIAPGEIVGRDTTLSYSHTVPAMIHDCSTLAGNSGSAIVDVGTGEVLGLHFKGITLKANFSVPMYELARDERVLEAGVNSFTASVPRDA